MTIEGAQPIEGAETIPGGETLAETVQRAPRQYVTTRKRVLSRRGVLWLGQTCNLRCYFCYFLNRISDNKHPEHDFMTLEKAKEICRTLREYYGNNAIDIQGGEPTIFPGILDLISYCREIGLHPTLITNGIYLAKPGVMEKFKEAGIRDFLVSLHGIGEIHDEVVGRKKAYEKIIAAIERMIELDVPFRFNCTMSKPVVPILPEIARKAVKYGAAVVNFIAFNPFNDQETGIRTHENVARYSDIMPKLTEAMDILEEAGIEVNVRFMPLCMAEERHRKNFYNFQQLSYDLHEWDYQSWLWTEKQPQRMKEADLTPVFRLGRGARRIYLSDPHKFNQWCKDHPLKSWVALNGQRTLALMKQQVTGKEALYREEAMLRAMNDLKYTHPPACEQCALRTICDGFHGDYADFHGTDEAIPVTDIPTVDDPLHFIQHQDKIVEEEDKAWAL